MRRIAIYGKGGIGKSTISSNISIVLAKHGLKVMQIGCDPKADSTRFLTEYSIPTVLDTIRKNDNIELEDIVFEGECGVLCVECGGPKPGIGCAGRGIIKALEKLEELDVINHYKPDLILYDVLGDVVCGGFAMPIRNGYARDVFIVTSGEMMSLYAASNIACAVNGFVQDGYAGLKGLIQNSRGIDNENNLVDQTALDIGIPVIYRIQRDNTVQISERVGKTVVSAEPMSIMASSYRDLALKVFEASEDVSGGMQLESR